MIEVLVTIVVISFGFLSLLSLQMATLNNLAANNQNTLAFSIANGMGERLRSNIVNKQFYDLATTKNFTKNCSTAGTCTMIEQDHWEFKQAISAESQLPQAEGSIKVIGGFADINITWLEKKGTKFTYTLQVPL